MSHFSLPIKVDFIDLDLLQIDNLDNFIFTVKDAVLESFDDFKACYLVLIDKIVPRDGLSELKVEHSHRFDVALHPLCHIEHI